MKQKLLKTMLLLSALVVGLGNVWAEETATLNLNSSISSPVTDNGVTFTWTSANIAVNNGSTSGFKASSNMTITLPSGATLTNISKTNGNLWGDGATVVVYAGSDNTGTSIASIVTGTHSYSISSNNTGGTYYLENSTKKNAWITSLTITYTPSGGGGSSVAAPTFSPVAGAVAAGTTVTLTQDDADEIRYTTDGTDPTKTTGTVYSSPIEITTATTIKAIAVEDDEVSSVATAAYTITVTAPEFNLASSGNYLVGTGLTLTSAGNTIYYNLTTNGDTPDNPTSASTEYTGPIALSSGTVKVKAIAYDAYGNTSSVASRTVNGVAPATLPFSWEGTSSSGKDNLAAQTGVVLSLGSDYATSNAPYRLKFDGTTKYVEIFTNEKPEAVTFTAKLYNATSTGSKIKVQGSNDGVDFADIEEFTIDGVAGATFEFTTSNAFATSHRVVKIVLSVKDQNVGVGSITITRETLPVTVGTDSYATFASNVPLDFTDSDIKAYIAEPNGTTGVTFTQINKVPANTGVLLYKDGGATEDIPVTSASTDYLGNNVFVPGTGAAVASVSGSVHNYILNNIGGNIGFYRANGQTVATNRAYIRIDESIWGSSVKEFIALPGFEDDADGISLTPALSEGEGAIYNVAGQRLSKMQKGINIVNGKKVLK